MTDVLVFHDGRVAKFTCTDCGANVERFAPSRQTRPVCLHCEALPGWHKDPKLRAILGEP